MYIHYTSLYACFLSAQISDNSQVHNIASQKNPVYFILFILFSDFHAYIGYKPLDKWLYVHYSKNF